MSYQKQILASNERYDLVTFSLGGQVTSEPTEDTKLKDSNEWVLLYSNGGKYRNLYLEQLALRMERSPTHAACLNKRYNYFIGQGLTTEDEAWLSKMASVNAYGESIQELIEKDIIDTDWSGNSYIEIVKVGSDYQFFHRRAQSADWTKAERQSEYKPIFYPKFPDYGDVKDPNNPSKKQKHKRAIIHYKSYDPRSVNYGRPHYVSAINDIDIEYRISKYNLDEFDNGFKADMVMTIFKDIKDENEFKEAKEELKSQHTGEGKNGGFIIEAVDSIDGKPAVIQKIDRTTDGQFLAEAERVQRNIIKAHGLTPSLAGVATAGQLGSSQQIISEFEIFQNTQIEPFHASKLRWYTKLFNATVGAPREPLKIPISPPVSKVNGIDPKLVLEIEEQREEIGYPAEYDPSKLIKQQSNGISNSGASNQ
jgi:hypothetical protein